MISAAAIFLFTALAAVTTPPHLDLDADTDHTGFVEHSSKEEELEDKEGEQGVILLPNWDDDDPPGTAGHGSPDCLTEDQFARVAFPNRKDRFDNAVNGARDKDEDMQLLTLRKVPAIPRNWKIILRVSEGDAEKVRIFDENDRPVILPRAAAEFVPDKAGKVHNEHQVPNLEGPAHQFLEYHVEGILPGEQLKIELVALEGTEKRAGDLVKARVAPFLLLPNERPVHRAFTADFRSLQPELRQVLLPGLLAEEDAVRQAAAQLAETTTAPPSDSFWQDPIQVGYAVAPGPRQVRTMILLARLPRAAHNFISTVISQKSETHHWLWPNRPSDLFATPPEGNHPALLGPGIGVYEIAGPPETNRANHGGNIEVTWPLPESGRPFGRIVIGKEMSGAYRDFLARQEVQTPLLELELNWLLSRHVDDVVYFLSGRQVAMPSPALGEQLLREFFRTNPNPSKAVFLKGPEVITGQFSAVETAGEHLILTDRDTDLSALRPGMYIHIFEGKGRYQTYDILKCNSRAMVVQQEAARFFSFWRSEPVETPGPGSRYIVVERPLHNTRSQVLLITLAELLDRDVRSDNQKIREFWNQNKMADELIKTKILPEIRKLSPARIIELPMLFHQLSLSNVTADSAPFTPNLVNGHLFGNTFLMPKPFVLSTSSTGGDLFEAAARRALHGFETRFVDDYFTFHNFQGEIHCALNLIPEAPSKRPFWWEAPNRD